MEQLPLTFNQASVEPEIQAFYTPAYNFTRINSSNGRLAFTENKVYWLPDAPMAMLDQGWVINISEIEGCSKYGISGFIIKLVDGKELRFSNVGGKMREGITAAIEERRGNPVAEAPVAEPAAAEPAAAEPAAAAAPEAAAPEAAPAAAPGVDPADASSNKVMAVLAYLGILVLVPLLAAKESKFARFHTNQGLILLICSIVSFAIGKVPSIAFISWILNIAILILAIIGIINAVKGETKELPLVGKFTIIK